MLKNYHDHSKNGKYYRMMIILSHNRFLMCSDQTDCQGDRKDQTIHSTCKYKKYCRISKDKHNGCRNNDKSDDHFIFIFLDRLAESLQEGN